jgi:threonine synthase
MKFLSTRKKSLPASFSEGLFCGLAPDGGLHVPESWPVVDFASLDVESSLAEIALPVLAPFFSGDELEPHLQEICRSAFSFAAPLKTLNPKIQILELFHGPTLSFKDYGARFLSECFKRHAASAGAPVTILVATSGDTGSAVAAAFHQKPGVQVVVLYPKGGVSERQEKQLTGWGENVRSLRVAGSFDDCQNMVKTAFQNSALKSRWRLTSANSINIGRLLPQMVYFASASLRAQALYGTEPQLVIPSGNLGNAVAAFWAKKLGAPIGHVVLATNANTVLADFFKAGEFNPRASQNTLANAMDVGNPSNLERLTAMYPDIGGLQKVSSCVSISDDLIKETIRDSFNKWNMIICPHTATAVKAAQLLQLEHAVVAATAHPAKFDSIVSTIIGRPVPIPLQLSQLLDRDTVVQDISTDPRDLERILNG